MSTETETNTDDLEHEAAEVSDDTSADTGAEATDQTDEDQGLDEDEQPEGDEGDDEGDGLEEVEWEGKTVRVTPEVKAALMRTADYTRKTQEAAEIRRKAEEDRAALDAREASLAQQAERATAIEGDRVQLAVIETQLKALDALDWDALEEEDPGEAQKLFRQRARLKDRQTDLQAKIQKTQTEFDAERKRSANEAHAKAVRDCEAVLKKDIKGWSEDLATKIGEFAVKQLGWSEQALVRLTDPAIIKTIHKAYLGDQAERRLKTQEKLKAGEKAAPVSRPGGGGPPNARRTTDGTGDKLSIDEWMRREAEREAAKRKR
jgi:microcompartment protein CcmL/EutN